MGAGIDMAPGDIAFKCNFATLDPATKIVFKRRADRHFEDVGPLLCSALNGMFTHAWIDLVTASMAYSCLVSSWQV